LPLSLATEVGVMAKARTNSYTHGHHRSVVEVHATRRASEAAKFLLPHLEPGMHLLDFGCGPGTISIDLAAEVYPGGTVVGIDLSESVIEQATARALELGVTNARFEVNSVYDPGTRQSHSTLRMHTKCYSMSMIPSVHFWRSDESWGPADSWRCGRSTGARWWCGQAILELRNSAAYMAGLRRTMAVSPMPGAASNPGSARRGFPR